MPRTLAVRGISKPFQDAGFCEPFPTGGAQLPSPFLFAFTEVTIMPLDFSTFLRDADVLIIVPPFAGLDRPSLGAHVLQACARQAGFSVSILYANLVLSEEMGELKYEAICYAPTTGLIGERFFAAAAYDVPPLGRNACMTEKNLDGDMPGQQIDLAEFQRLEARARAWVDEIVEAVLRLNFKIIGCTTTFEQTAASVALLNRIKRLRPDIITIIGGANCEGQMAAGIATLGAEIDFIFSGESETTFPEFLKQAQAGVLPPAQIVQGSPCLDLDAVPTPDFAEFYEQFQRFIPDSRLAESDNIWLPYESSRGCWWGEKHHCTFCGINGTGMKFREKSADRVISELKELTEKHPSRKVCMVDNIMPHTYFKSLIPRLGDEVPGLQMFYEQKANLTLDQVEALKRAGVEVIQPGIEALSTSLLKRMDKGVSARQNIALLRYARAVELGVNWNLLYAFPGDLLEEYEQTLSLLPLMRHLCPPDGPCHLSIDRFSPYFFAPEKYGVTNIRSMDSYASVLPEHADIENVAYHFIADYRSGSRENPEVIKRIEEELSVWRSLWKSEDNPAPVLAVTPLSDEQFLLLDTRGLEGSERLQFLTREEVSLILVARRADADVDVEWALERKLLVELDSFYVPLATAKAEILREFESEMRAVRDPRAYASLPVVQQYV
jgi:ribosomal peptide maturation radical SAM protein 1